MVTLRLLTQCTFTAVNPGGTSGRGQRKRHGRGNRCRGRRYFGASEASDDRHEGKSRGEIIALLNSLYTALCQNQSLSAAYLSCPCCTTIITCRTINALYRVRWTRSSYLYPAYWLLPFTRARRTGSQRLGRRCEALLQRSPQSRVRDRDGSDGQSPHPERRVYVRGMSLLRKMKMKMKPPARFFVL